ncbi:MAG: ABC transporter substrate-binding protein [Proteobacteria bacterium]|nr:ABC transporter substrate-binding protein [Pseudomonadota bacterium]
MNRDRPTRGRRRARRALVELRPPAARAALTLLLALAACETAPPTPPLPEGAVKVLAANPITGSLSFMGPALEHAMRFAANEINANGGLLGRPLHLITADSHSDEEAGLAEVRFYYQQNRDVVGILGDASDNVSKRLLVELARNNLTYGQRIPIISPAASSREFVGLLDAQYNLFYRTVCSSHLEGRILADKALALGFRVGAAVGVRDINTPAIFAEFQQRFQAAGVDYVVRPHYYETSSVTDVNATIDRAFTDVRERTGQAPDFLLVLAYGADGRIALTEWARKHATTPLLLTDALMSNYFLSSLDPTTVKQLEEQPVNGVFPGGNGVGRGASIFTEAFCRAHAPDCRCERPDGDCSAGDGVEPGIYTANAYDATFAFALALAQVLRDRPQGLDKQGGSWNVDRLTEALLDVTNKNGGDDLTILPGEWAKAMAALAAGRGLNYEGASSLALELDLNGDPINCSFSFWSVENGQVVFKNSEGQKESVAITL